jgi:hypothetical protein
MIQLVYTSRADPPFTESRIEDILFVSRRNNARDQITGVLFYHAGKVMQLLEGEPEKVLPLFEAICRDERHCEVTLVYTCPLPARQFGDWAMGFRPADTAFWDLPKGASDLRRLVTAIALQPESIARSTLLGFSSSPN